MTLFSVLIAFILERLFSDRINLQPRFVSLLKHFEREHDINGYPILIVLVFPLFIWAWLALVEGALLGLVSLMSWVAILFIMFCHYPQRLAYKKYAMSGCRQDFVAMTLYAEQLGVNHKDYEQTEQLDIEVAKRLVWINFRAFIAPIVLLSLIGPVAAVLYFCAYNLQQNGLSHPWVRSALFCIDSVLVKLVSLLYMLAGNFQNGTKLLFENLFDFKTCPSVLLGSVAIACMDESNSAIVSKCNLSSFNVLSLIKRTMLVALLLLALLTITALVG